MRRHRAQDVADESDQQSVTVCFAMEYRPGEDHTIDRPRQYPFWRDFTPPGWPGPLLGWTTPDPVTHQSLNRQLFEAPDGHPWFQFRRILLVLGGGGILYDLDAERYLREVFLAHEMGIPVMVYAISAGPLRHASARLAVRTALNQAAVITNPDPQRPHRSR